MKVLIVMAGPRDADQRYVVARSKVPLFRLLSGHGMDLHVVLLGDRGGLRHDLHLHVSSIRTGPPVPPSLWGLTRVPTATRRLREIASYLAPAIIDGSEPLPALVAGLAHRAPGHPMVLYRRHHASRGRALRLASRTAARFADGVVVSNHGMADRAHREDKVPRNRVFVAGSGTESLHPVSMDLVERTRAELSIGPNAKVLGVISRLRHEKGIDILLDAVDRIDHFDLHVIVAGVGPELERLKRRANQLRAPVHFLGHQSDVALWYAVSDIVVMPSRQESFGRTTVEAMAAGRPLVASAVGGLVEAVEDGLTGFLVPPNDPVALSSALGELMVDGDALERMGKAAKARYEDRYTIEAMATAWREVWESLASGSMVEGGAATS